MRRWPQMERYRLPPVLLDLGQRREVGRPCPIRLRRRRHVRRRLGKRVLRLRRPIISVGMHRRDRQRQRPRVGISDILRCGDDDPPRDERRVLAGGDHRREPVEGCVGIVAAHRLDERGRRLVVLVADAVVFEQPLLRRLGHLLRTDSPPSPTVTDADSSALSAWRASPPERLSSAARPSAESEARLARPRSASVSARSTMVPAPPRPGLEPVHAHARQRGELIS